jgi:hypothetical protein
MSKYQLVNPVITGKFQDTYEASTSIDAAKQFWNELTGNNYITNNVPQFMFTLEKTSDSSLHHFLVKEKATSAESKFADYSIEEVKLDLTAAQVKEFKNEVAKVHKKMGGRSQEGGKKKHRKRYEEDDSDSSSSDEDDLIDYIRMKRFNQPIVHWWYTPTLYKVPTLFTPTFVAPLYPYVQLWVPLR